MSKTVLVAVEADPHINSSMGLFPGRSFTPHKKPTMYPTALQRRVTRLHDQFWEHVQQQKKKRRAKLAVILLGDVLDINRHDGMDPLSTYKPDVLRMGAAVYSPIRELADWLFVVRGTEAHTGEWCELEEALARDLDATPDEREGTASWGWLWAEFAGVSVLARHRPRTGGRRPWTQTAATAREQAIVNIEFLRMGREPPDVAFVAHFHWYDISGNALKPVVVRCPAWKLLDGYGEQIGESRIVEQVGAVLMTCKDGRYTIEPWLKPVVRRTEPWRTS